MQAGDDSWQGNLVHWKTAALTSSDQGTKDGSQLSDLLLEFPLAAKEASLDFDVLREALFTIERKKLRVDDPSQLMPLEDQQWAITLSVAQSLRFANKLADAEKSVAALEELAPRTLEPAQRVFLTKIERAALFMCQGQYNKAAATYRNIQSLARSLGTYYLGIALLGVAQAAMMLGDYSAAELNLNRAEPLIGEDPNHTPALQLTRAHLSLLSTHPEWVNNVSLATAQVGTTAVTAEPQVSKQTMFIQAHRLHLEGHHDEALHAFEVCAALAYDQQDVSFLSDVLLQQAFVHEHLALATSDVDRAAQHHRIAMQKLSQARVIRQEHGHKLSTASIDVTAAEYIVQWHDRYHGVSHKELREALKRIIAAMRTIYSVSQSIAENRTRYRFVRSRLRHAFEAACSLALFLGDTPTLSALIVEATAQYDWRVVHNADTGS
ncbi:hypothetical protein ACUY2X_03055 [Corynebacterium minutissimum]